ncbi:MAG: glycine--tRNA ligase subunit beta [Parachlamydiales bacterium]
MLTVQELIARLDSFWAAQGCVIGLGHDVETGAGTFNPNTFFKCLGPEPFRAAYVEISRRPTDGRYGDNPNRMQLFHQYQIVLKPSPPNPQELYLQMLEAIGFHLPDHDIRFVHDDWEQPSLGASGLGWEVWRDGMEVTQYTYFQSVAGFELDPIMVEMALGLERLAMTIQGVDNVWDLKWNDHLTYGDLYHKGEVEWCHYNFEQADVATLRSHYADYVKEAHRLAALGLPYPAYDFVMKASHTFNTLEARGVVSVPERAKAIGQIRGLAKAAAESYVEERRKLQFPLMDRWEDEWTTPSDKKEKPAPDRSEVHPFLLEIGSEELPATYIPTAMASLKGKLERLLQKSEFPYTRIEVYGSPRRLAALIEGLPLLKPAQQVERRGPPLTSAFDEAGNPTKAGAGFFRSIGREPQHRDHLEGVEIREGYLYADLQIPAQRTDSLLAEALPSLILDIDFPKKMRWGRSKISYARPLHWIVALHGKWVLPFQVGSIASGRTTYGHRQRANKPLSLSSPSDYLSTLRKAYVMVDPEERKTAILEQLSRLEGETGGEALALPRVLPEVVNLTEWPELFLGSFDSRFLNIPQEVPISVMVHHQRYFPLANGSGALQSRFVITGDNTPNETIRKGNEKVLTARLTDGEFLFQQDLKVPLDQFNEQLKAITFHEGLGTLHDKSLRLVAQVKALHDRTKLGNLAEAEMAALYAKSDLASKLVGEFPELQGTVGHAYALAHGLPVPVAHAIDEHWMPRGEKGSLPTTPAGALLSLADKIDNLLACFSLGLLPTSSSDPFALRRQALALIRITIAERLHLPLKETLEACYAPYSQNPNTIPALLDFLQNRIATVFQDYGFSKPQIASALSHGVTDIYDSYLRTAALHEAQKSDPAFPLLAEVYKRARGILPEKTTPFDPAKATEPAEQALAKAFSEVEKHTLKAIEVRDYPEAYRLIARLQPPLHTFFEQVRVLAEDNTLKTNRLALIGAVFGLFDRLLDFSKLHLTAS